MHIRPITPADEAAVINTLVTAFGREPIGDFIYPDAAARDIGQTKMFTDLIKNRDPTKMSVDVTDDLDAVAVWEYKTASDVDDHSLAEEEGLTPDGQLLFTQVDENEPEKPFLYLAFIGAASAGTGAGSALIRHGLERVKQGEKVALFTSIRSVPFYARFGFKVTTTIEVKGFAVVWMIRE
ncbi:hypothetical protein HDU99_007077 [Rhizoclosmatium hyalinum]|nr:hypothetical protein HDU99_007077 [Rhizoclosmatium hyalinum]